MSSTASGNLEQLDLFQPQEYTLDLDLGLKSIGWACSMETGSWSPCVYLFENAKEISNSKFRSLGKLRLLKGKSETFYIRYDGTGCIYYYSLSSTIP